VTTKQKSAIMKYQCAILVVIFSEAGDIYAYGAVKISGGYSGNQIHE